MRILHLNRIDISEPENNGVYNKQIGQVHALRLNHHVDYINLRPNGVYKNDDVIFELKKPITKKEKFRLFKFYHFQFYKIISHLCKPTSYDLIYIRFHAMHYSFYTFLQNAKSEQTKVIIEIPTYPYDSEYKGFLQKQRLRVDRGYRTKIEPYVDFIVHYGPHEQIYGIPTINLTNGIDTRKNYQKSALNASGALDMVAIGKWQEWHGLDRLLFGLSKYKGDIKITLKIIGDGPELPKYKEIVSKNKLASVVTFIQGSTDIELDNILDGADIGVGSLADHRKSLTESSPLKNREYCLRGIPFILSTKDLDFPEKLPFVHYIPVDDSIVDINQLIEFHKQLPEDIQSTMIEYGKQNLGWDKKMKVVIDHLKPQN